ncbi:MAG: hypothetical protein GX964_11170 [Syntrophomonadaceae bacterium]|nr:hypothetical protein [Syntrophomonadaceae bacterium]
MADLVMELTNWEIYSAREVRNKYSLNRANRFRGSVVRDGHEYAVYLVSSNPYARTLSAIQGEIKFLACSTPIRRAMVFAPNHDVLERFGLDDQEAEELLLLIYPDSLQLLNNYHSDEFQSYLQSLVAGFAPTDSPFADYEADDEYVADLILNDIVKINSLAAYFHLQHRKKVSIICLDSQKELMQSRFPSARQIIIPNKKGVDSFARRT